MTSYEFQPITMSHNPGENEAATTTLRRWYEKEDATEAKEYLPPGMTPITWEIVLQRFRDALGMQKVIVDKELQINYMDPFSMNADEKEKRGSACALRPTTVEEIQAILKIANEHKIPLWTVSRGRNLGYGGPAARVKVRSHPSCSRRKTILKLFQCLQGSVIIDLQNMNKILEINDKFSYYTVEPGVSFFQLFQEIQAQKKKIWSSTPALGWGSVVGNALDRVSFNWSIHGDCYLTTDRVGGTLPMASTPTRFVAWKQFWQTAPLFERVWGRWITRHAGHCSGVVMVPPMIPCSASPILESSPS